LSMDLILPHLYEKIDFTFILYHQLLLNIFVFKNFD